MKIARKKSLLTRKTIIIPIVLILILCVGLTYAYFNSKSTEQNGASQGSKENDVPVSKSDNSGAISSPRTNDKADAEKPDSSSNTLNTKPAVPSGVFVSNHRPNISGSPAPNTISSTCTTTPNTDCYISFTNGNTTKSLPRQKTDSYGNTSWFWNLSDTGITSGSWSITAVAENGPLKSTSKDPMDLIVNE